MARPRGDHAARRREVVRATCGLIARRGLDGTTVRAVAAELGVATKAVTRYFRSKDELLRLALDFIIEEQIRISAKQSGRADSVDGLVRLLGSALPTTRAVRNGWRIWVAFLGQAVGNPALQRYHRERYERLRALMLEWLGRFAEHGAIPRRVVNVSTADHLLALVDGIGVREATTPGSIPAARQRRMIADAAAWLASR